MKWNLSKALTNWLVIFKLDAVLFVGTEKSYGPFLSDLDGVLDNQDGKCSEKVPRARQDVRYS